MVRTAFNGDNMARRAKGFVCGVEDLCAEDNADAFMRMCKDRHHNGPGPEARPDLADVLDKISSLRATDKS